MARVSQTSPDEFRRACGRVSVKVSIQSTCQLAWLVAIGLGGLCQCLAGIVAHPSPVYGTETQAHADILTGDESETHVIAGSKLESTRRPNVLFILADDLSYEALGAIGRVDIETPHLDSLARRGTHFTHAYNMGSFSPAVCVASRTMLITGRSLWHAHEQFEATDKHRVAGRLWPQLMASQGYDTYFTGKWHIKADVNQSFDTVRHVRPGMPSDAPSGYHRPPMDRPDVWSPFDVRLGGYWEGGKHWSEVVADDAIDFLHLASQRTRPFFMYVAFNAPHDPRQSPQEFINKYPLERVAVPRNFLPLYPFRDAIGCGAGLRDETLVPFPRTEHAVKVHRQEYFAIISHLDVQIGRILAALDQSGQADNTWIVATADHGLAVGQHGLVGKQNMYEHSLRVPFLVVGPKVVARRRIHTPIYLQDVMPTVLEVAGRTPPDYVEFQSLMPLLNGEPQTAPRDVIYAAYLDLQRAVVHDGWKLIVYPAAHVVRLYHVANDPDELRDLADVAEHAARRNDLVNRLLRVQRQMHDPLDLKFDNQSNSL